MSRALFIGYLREHDARFSLSLYVLFGNLAIMKKQQWEKNIIEPEALIRDDLWMKSYLVRRYAYYRRRQLCCETVLQAIGYHRSDFPSLIKELQADPGISLDEAAKLTGVERRPFVTPKYKPEYRQRRR